MLYVEPTNVGSIITLPYGSPVYVNIDEHRGKTPRCRGSCAKVWVPVITGQAPGAASGVVSSEVGTTDYNGAKQVTYYGRRLYYDAFDRQPLQAGGQGTGGVWYVILPTGQVLQTSA